MYLTGFQSFCQVFVWAEFEIKWSGEKAEQHREDLPVWVILEK